MRCGRAMRISLVLALAVWLPAAAAGRFRQHEGGNGQSLTEAYSFYHTSGQLQSEAQELANSGGCQGLEVQLESEDGVSLPVARLRAHGQEDLRFMLVFGEHARELISPETGLHFLRRLCSADGSSARASTSFTLVLNANPVSRQKVEEHGEYCLRTNENNVDLNRNYGDHWQASAENGREEGVGGKSDEHFETYSSGSGPLSEPETRVVARVLASTKPDIFLDVHSGTKGLFMPPDWTTDPLPNTADSKNMLAAIQAIQSSDCPDCTAGEGAETVGYLAPGSSADYAYSQGVKFAFIWEIYTDPESNSADLRANWEYKEMKNTPAPDPLDGLVWHTDVQDIQHEGEFLTQHRHVKRQAPPDWVSRDEKEFAKLQAKNDEHCFGLFNPVTQQGYQETVQRWSTAFLDLCDQVRQLRAGGSSANVTSAEA